MKTHVHIYCTRDGVTLMRPQRRANDAEGAVTPVRQKYGGTVYEVKGYGQPRYFKTEEEAKAWLMARTGDRRAKDAPLTFASRKKGQALYKEGQKLLAQANEKGPGWYQLLKEADQLFAEARKLSMIEDGRAKDGLQEQISAWAKQDMPNASVEELKRIAAYDPGSRKSTLAKGELKRRGVDDRRAKDAVGELGANPDKAKALAAGLEKKGFRYGNRWPHPSGKMVTHSFVKGGGYGKNGVEEEQVWKSLNERSNGYHNIT